MKNFDALKLYESTEVEPRTLLHVPSGTFLSMHLSVRLDKI